MEGPPPPKSHKQFYDCADIFGGDYVGVMGLCNLGAVGTLAVEDVSVAVNASAAQRIPTAFLVLGVRLGYVVPTVQMYHRMTTFAPHMWLPVTQWDGKLYAFSRDTFAERIPTVVR